MTKSVAFSGLVFAVIALATAVGRPTEPVDEPFVLDFKQLQQVTPADHWKVLTNQSDRQQVIGTRRVRTQRYVAICRVAAGDHGRVSQAVEAEIDRQLRAAGAMQKGEFSLNHSLHTTDFGGPESIRITAPRLLFAVGRRFGVLDLSVTGHNGFVTISISCTQ